MPDTLKDAPVWFLIMAVILTGGGFLYLVNRSFGRFDTTLLRFETLFDKIFEKHEKFDSRLSRLEGAHEARRKDDVI